MATYVITIPIPANTPKTVPVIKTKVIEKGVITKWMILIPDGVHALAHFQILYGLEQLIPKTPGDWFTGNGESIEIDEFWELPEPDTLITVMGYNEDIVYDHTFIIRIIAMPKWVAKFGLILKNFVNLLKTLLGV